jgi:hypothetical protein
LRRRLQIRADTRNRPRPRIPAVSKIEHKTRIAKHFPAESGGRRVVPSKEIFYLSKQMHLG